MASKNSNLISVDILNFLSTCCSDKEILRPNFCRIYQIFSTHDNQSSWRIEKNKPI